MKLSIAPRFAHSTRTAIAASLLLIAASASQATVCRTLANGKVCLMENTYRCGRGWMVVPAQGLVVATPWTC